MVQYILIMMFVKLLQIGCLFLLVGCETYQQKAIRTFDPSQIKKLSVKKERINPRGKHQYTMYGKKYRIRKGRNHFHQTGIASWYLGSQENSVTAINEPYDMYALTAAHKTLPLPTYAIITNLENHKQILVKINDRGPYVDNRILDLSYAAAYQLGMIKNGLTRVQIDTIDHY